MKKDDFFDAERKLEKAMGMLRSRQDWEGMAQTVEALLKARQGRRKKTMASRAAVRLVDEAIDETATVEPGRYLLQPPLVGADARRLRLQAKDQDVEVLVVCREPTTRLGEIPVVAIAPGATIRLRIDPPKSEAKPSASWFRSALEALGDEAVAMDRPDMEAAKRIDRLLALLDAVPDADAPHTRLIEACRTAATETD
jgi:hypothetical protein